MLRSDLLDYLEELLSPADFKDYAPNGLQVEGLSNINKIIAGVSLSQLLIKKAISENADAVLVHHGMFWQGDDPTVTSFRKGRIKNLLVNNINLIAYHLPLDFHPVYGNNVLFGKYMGFSFGDDITKDQLYLAADFNQPMLGSDLFDLLYSKLKRKPLLIGSDTKEIKKVAWCVGRAPNFLEEAALGGADAYITGEVSENIVHIARELDINLYIAGHHATERYGVEALGKHLAEKFNIDCEFVDIDSPL
ncbi:MAG: Nif3-like dinuclear metal center hexameric protein [Gammaproteobacteria bacterium]|nr:Nif3-like dinuclear metal center hexameric protein [Gammaproteobacteria bacterium]